MAFTMNDALNSIHSATEAMIQGRAFTCDSLKVRSFDGQRWHLYYRERKVAEYRDHELTVIARPGSIRLVNALMAYALGHSSLQFVREDRPMGPVMCLGDTAAVWSDSNAAWYAHFTI